MTKQNGSISFHASNFRCFCTHPHPISERGLHDAHIHGSLDFQLDDVICKIPSEDVCINGFAVALRQIRNHIVGGTRNVDPTTYVLRGPTGWPELEFIRADDDILRVAVLFDGEGESTVTSVRELRQAVDGFLEGILHLFETMSSVSFVVSGLRLDFFESACKGFQNARAAQEHVGWLQSAADPTRIPDMNAEKVVCVRTYDMEETPVQGSIRGECMRCGQLLWIAPSSCVTIEECSSPVVCRQCAASQGGCE
jgi:hypothetical protein